MDYRLATTDDFEEIVGMYKSAIDAMNADGIMQWDDIYPTADDIRKDIDTQEMYVGLKDSRICVAYTINKESDSQYQNAAWEGGINYLRMVINVLKNVKRYHPRIVHSLSI